MIRIARAVLLALSPITLVIHSASASAQAKFSVLYSFLECKLGEPAGQLHFKGSTLYGTGTGFRCSPGNGQVFRLAPSGGTWKETSIFKFDKSDGQYPFGGLINDAYGNLYGTTSNGGTTGQGTAFELSSVGGKWKETVLYNFTTVSGGLIPSADLINDSAGDIFGTTQYGGSNDSGICVESGCGTVFELYESGGAWKETVIYSFNNGTDGAFPMAGLHSDSAGNIYGTTSQGGGSDGSQCGVVFELSPSGSSWTFQTLYTFVCGAGDGEYPSNGHLVLNTKTGALYGTAGGGAYMDGVVYALTPSGGTWTESLLHTFNGADDGAGPNGLNFTRGVLYGTTVAGGSCTFLAKGCGMVYSLTPSGSTWSEVQLYNFSGGSDGALPNAAVIVDASGNIYGTAYAGGADANGTVWKITP